jgi:hypothetical protein
MLGMDADGLLADTRASYDSYAAQVSASFAAEPHLRAALAVFVGIVRGWRRPGSRHGVLRKSRVMQIPAARATW